MTFDHSRTSQVLNDMMSGSSHVAVPVFDNNDDVRMWDTDNDSDDDYTRKMTKTKQYGDPTNIG